MMKRFFFISLVLYFFACTDKASKGVLSVQQMQEIQWDLMRADELVEYYKAADTLYKTNQKREEFYDRIFSLHHTNKETFARSLDYYTARPKELKVILDSVQAKADRITTADTVNTRKDSAVLLKDTVRLPRTIDSFKRKKGLKVGP